jgi:Bacteriocin-protection, YdeI or OmpD-Associated/Domain of unknown function (DUF1905)
MQDIPDQKMREGWSMAAKTRLARFMAVIYKIWLMRHIDVPDEIAHELMGHLHASATGARREKRAKANYIPVIATVGGKSTRTTIVPAGGGKYRMQINTAQRKAACVDWGDAVSVELRVDLASRVVPVPADLRAALAKHPKARKGFDEMPPGHRRQFLMWVASGKRPETRRKHLERAIDHLIERAILKPRRSS